MKKIDLIEYIKSFEYKKYIKQQLYYIINPLAHYQELKNVFYNEKTETVKIMTESTQSFLQNKNFTIDIPDDSIPNASHNLESLSSSFLTLITPEQSALLLKAS